MFGNKIPESEREVLLPASSKSNRTSPISGSNPSNRTEQSDSATHGTGFTGGFAMAASKSSYKEDQTDLLILPDFLLSVRLNYPLFLHILHMDLDPFLSHHLPYYYMEHQIYIDLGNMLRDSLHLLSGLSLTQLHH